MCTVFEETVLVICMNLISFNAFVVMIWIRIRPCVSLNLVSGRVYIVGLIYQWALIS